MHYQAVTYGDTTSLLLVGNTVRTVISESHPKFDAIRDYFEGRDEADHDEAYVERLIDVSSLVGVTLSALSDRVAYGNGRLYFDAEPVSNVLADKIVALVRESAEAEELEVLVRFLENLSANPNAEAREELWTFLSHSNYTLTRRGTFIGYKKVRDDRLSVHAGTNTVFVNGEAHTGRVPYPDGAVVEMARSEADSDSRTACSNGLHVGTFPHANGFSGDVLLAVEVDPRDVVAVPMYDSTKLRARKVRVHHEIDGEIQDTIWQDTEDVSQFEEVAESLTEDEASQFEDDAQEDDTTKAKPVTLATLVATNATVHYIVADRDNGGAFKVGHREAARQINERLGQQVTTESSVRRYRKHL